MRKKGIGGRREIGVLVIEVEKEALEQGDEMWCVDLILYRVEITLHSTA